MWSLVWFIFGQNTPASHPNITLEERRYIETSLEQDKNTEVCSGSIKNCWLHLE